MKLVERADERTHRYVSAYIRASLLLTDGSLNGKEWKVRRQKDTFGKWINKRLGTIGG